MIKTALLTLSTMLHLLLAGTAAAESLEAARAAQDEGRFIEAARLGEELGTSAEYALARDPEMAGAHLSLATWHAETINGAGVADRVVFGASRKRALAHYERALGLAPDEKLAHLEYALGLLLLKKKDRKRAPDLLARAIETPSKDTFDRLLHELAVEKLANLGGK